MLRMYDINQMNNNKIQLVLRVHGKIERMLTIKIGDTLFIEPDNPLKLENRGRECVIKNFKKDDVGHPIQAVVTFTDNGKSGHVDLRDLAADQRPVVEVTDRNLNQDASIPRFFPEEVPDYLFTQNELKSMGRIPAGELSAFVTYPEQKNEFKLFHIDNSRLTKKQSRPSLLSNVLTVEEVLEKRKRSLAVRKEQLPPNRR